MKTLYRARILTFERAPLSLVDEEAYSYYSDGYLLVENLKIVGLGSFESRPAEAFDLPFVDYRPFLILPGFIDTHSHFPQMRVIASYGTKLMEWLEKYTFPEEAKFQKYDYAKMIARSFIETLIDHGTTTSVTFCTVHSASVDAIFEEANKKNMCMVAGKVMMDRNAPSRVLDDAQSSYDESKNLIEKWHKNRRAKYAISPRFAITSTPGQLEAAGTLYAKYDDCYLQTHLSENLNEISAAMSLFPERKNYLDIYNYYGLLGPKSLLGHCIHLDPYERSQMVETGAVAVHCPTSNLFLGSGLFDMDDFNQRGIKVAVATDTGGGTSYSMLSTLSQAYKIQQLRNYNFDPLQSIYSATLGNAIALGLEHEIGCLKKGAVADFIVLDSHATSVSRNRMETCQDLIEELFILQTLGDDRSVKAVYIAGSKAK